jgi:hypothetical protein
MDLFKVFAITIINLVSIPVIFLIIYLVFEFYLFIIINNHIIMLILILYCYLNYY